MASWPIWRISPASPFPETISRCFRLVDRSSLSLFRYVAKWTAITDSLWIGKGKEEPNLSIHYQYCSRRKAQEQPAKSRVAEGSRLHLHIGSLIYKLPVVIKRVWRDAMWTLSISIWVGRNEVGKLPVISEGEHMKCMGFICCQNRILTNESSNKK